MRAKRSAPSPNKASSTATCSHHSVTFKQSASLPCVGHPDFDCSVNQCPVSAVPQLCPVLLVCVHSARVRSCASRKPRRLLIGRLAGPMRERVLQRLGYLPQRPCSHTLSQIFVSDQPPRSFTSPCNGVQMRPLIQDQCLGRSGRCT